MGVFFVNDAYRYTKLQTAVILTQALTAMYCNGRLLISVDSFPISEACVILGNQQTLQLWGHVSKACYTLRLDSPPLFVYVGRERFTQSSSSNLHHLRLSITWTPAFAMTATSNPVSESTTADVFYAIEPEVVSGLISILTLTPLPERKRWILKSKQNLLSLRTLEERTVSLDTAGFQFYKQTSKHTTFDNDEEIYCEYYPETIELI